MVKIISVGYRVKSLRGTQFRIWASSVLKEYMRKGNQISKLKKKNKGEMDSFYIEDNHSPIVSKEVWEHVQQEMKIWTL